MTAPPGHPIIPSPHIGSPRIGVLLVNLGTPDAPTPGAVRRYLRQFLSDPRVVEIPQIVWQPILRGIILTTRPRKSAHAYAQIWTEHGSPLAVHSAAQAQGLQARYGDTILVRHAMRYGRPALDEAMLAMREQGCERILLAPLYPQYCAATTASAIDALCDALAKMRWQPSVRTLPPYYDHPAYIEALAESVREALGSLDFAPDHLLASFHAMPLRTLELGDPYHCHCQKTARLLSEALGRPVGIAFQSRFGRAKWLGPATDAEFKRIANSGAKALAVIAPGFSADCLETLEELNIRGRHDFLAAGGERFAYIPCLNASERAIAMLKALIDRELSGWEPGKA
ncbi:MAG: ferrochelatase [Sphingopyxis sp.]